MITSADVRTAGLFRATDRCDRCPARARVLVVLRCGGELTFCAHHAGMHRNALELVTARFVHDVERSEHDDARAVLGDWPVLPRHGG